MFSFRSSFCILRPFALPLDDREVYNVSNLFFICFAFQPEKRKLKFELRLVYCIAIGNCCNKSNKSPGIKNMSEIIDRHAIFFIFSFEYELYQNNN